MVGVSAQTDAALVWNRDVLGSRSWRRCPGRSFCALVAAPVLTMRGVHGGATVARNPDGDPDTRASGSAREFAIASAFRADAPTPAEVRRADAADLVRMDDDGGRQQWATT